MGPGEGEQEFSDDSSSAVESAAGEGCEYAGQIYSEGAVVRMDDGYDYTCNRRLDGSFYWHR